MVIALLSMASNSLGHGGRTDSSGGHNCSQKSVGKGLCSGYHYHNKSSIKPKTLRSKKTVVAEKRAPKEKYLSPQEADLYMYKRLWGLQQSDIDETQLLYTSLQRNLTLLKCEGEEEYKTTSELGEMVKNKPRTDYFSLNDRYLFMEVEGIWMLLGKKIDDKWINQHPKFSKLFVTDLSIKWTTTFRYRPLGDLNLSDILDTEMETVFVDFSNTEITIDRQTGRYYHWENQSFYIDSPSIPSFTNKIKLEGECIIASKESKF